MNLRTRTSIAAVAVASVIGGGVAGAVLTGPAAAVAQETEDAGSPVADGITTIDEVLAQLVDEGVLTQAQADRVGEALEEARPERRPRGHRLMGALHTVAETLGLTVEELGTALMDGESLADIAVANGAEPEDLVDVFMAEAQSRLDAAVADGRLTAEEAAEKAAVIESRITKMVNGELEFGRRWFGPGRGFGPDASDDAGAINEATANA
jgi:hypothetical protein